MGILSDELAKDPKALGWAGKSNAVILTEINTAIRLVNRESISGAELFKYTVQSEFDLLNDSQKLQWITLCKHGQVFKEAIPIIKSIFPAPTATWQAIVKTETVSRAQELGLPKVRMGQIERAR